MKEDKTHKTTSVTTLPLSVSLCRSSFSLSPPDAASSAALSDSLFEGLDTDVAELALNSPLDLPADFLLILDLSTTPSSLTNMMVGKNPKV